MKRIFELWNGNIESHDGALQLLQIVDYIWTWARDIYRIQVLYCLCAHRSQAHDVPSPFSLRFRTASVLSHPSPILPSIESEHAFDENRSEDAMDVEDEDYPFAYAEIATAHPFLKLAGGYESSPSWTALHNVRHANIVEFSYSIIDLTEKSNNQLNEGYASSLPTWLRMDQINTLEIHRKDAERCLQYWVGDSNQKLPTRDSDTDTVVIFFRTECRPRDWQIRRILIYVILPSDPPAKQVIPFDKLFETLQQLYQISGSHSAHYALCNMSLYLERTGQQHQEIVWKEISTELPVNDMSLSMCVKVIEAPDTQYTFCYNSPGTLLMITSNDYDVDALGLPAIPAHLGKEEGILSVKSESWPAACPRFCLFVSLQGGFDRGEVLRDLLIQTLRSGRNVYLNKIGGLTKEDTNALKIWARHLSAV